MGKRLGTIKIYKKRKAHEEGSPLLLATYGNLTPTASLLDLDYLYNGEKTYYDHTYLWKIREDLFNWESDIKSDIVEIQHKMDLIKVCSLTPIGEKLERLKSLEKNLAELESERRSLLIEVGQVTILAQLAEQLETIYSVAEWIGEE